MTSTPIFDALAAELRAAGTSSDESCAPQDQAADPSGQEAGLSGRLE
ncbi:hypothetical protein OG205_09515 [Lentzea sp. NBC_00516]|nr:hypothetical protein [Lentzea sp. NBC_00516]WUD27212.1 hypothetical protein OG205_09515 [Lentzea sp. NBC_00516]